MRARILAAVLAIGVIGTAGAAFAGHRSNNGYGRNYADCPCVAQGMPAPRGQQGFNGNGQRFNKRGFNAFCQADMPQEIRDKLSQAAKLRIDLRSVLAASPIDRAKAVEIHAQIQKLNQDVGAWRFGKRLDYIAQFSKPVPVSE